MPTEPLGYHIMMRLVDGRVIAPSTRERRVVAQTITHRARGFTLLAFCAADTHLHLLALLLRAEVGRLTRRIAVSLQRRLHRGQSRFARPYPKPVLDQQHLVNAFEYILSQGKRHKLAWDPLHESSNLPDLLGMRLSGAWTARHVREHLPRVDRPQLLECLELADLDPLPSAQEPLELLTPAALSASGRVDAPLTAPARQAAVAVAGSRLSTAQLAVQLRVSTRTIVRDRAAAPDDRLVHAVRLQLAARSQLTQAPSGAFAGSQLSAPQTGQRPLGWPDGVEPDRHTDAGPG